MNAVINHPSHPSSRCRGSAHGHLSRASSTEAKASSSWQHLQSPSQPVVDHGGSSSCWPLRQRQSPAGLACPKACRTPVPRQRQPVDPGRSQPPTPTRHSSPERTDEAGRSAPALSRAPVVAPGRSRSPRVCGEREHRIGLTPQGRAGGMRPCRGMRPTDSYARKQRPTMAEFVASGSTFAWNPPALRCRQSIRLARTRRGR